MFGSTPQRRWVVGGLIVVGMLLAALVAASQIRSPATVAASARPPALPAVTGPVDLRVLEDAASYAATVGTAGTLSIAAPDTVEGRRLITAVVASPGEAAEEGEVLLAVAGRPVIVMRGTAPAYRAFVPGARGEDVRQLQRALNRLGYPAGASGVVDERTQRALGRLYAARGYSADGQVVGEIVFVPSLPAAVKELSAAIGSMAEGTVATLGYGGPAVLADITDGATVKAGQSVVIEAAGTRVGGRVVRVDATAVEGAPNRVVAVAVPDDPLPAGATSALLHIVRASSGDKVLVVPASALLTRDTGSVVRVQRGDEVAEVEVEVGMTAGGYVAVTSPDLSVGDLVVLGP